MATGPDASKVSPDVSVVSTAHDLADARLHRTCAALLRAGLRVEVRGLGDPGDAPPGTAAITLGQRAGKVTRLRHACALPFQASGTAVVTFDPDLVPAAILRRWLGRVSRRRRPVVVDVHEDYVALLADRSWARGLPGMAARTLAHSANRLARGADLTVVADAHVPPSRARHRLVVRNLPDPEYLPRPSEPEPEPRAIYIGDVRASRGLRTMIEAVAAAPPWTLDLVGPVSAQDRPWLNEWLAGSPDADRVRVHGRQPPARAWALASGAWAGLVLLADTPAFRAAVPTKLYEYLGCGLAVAATPLPRMAQIVEESGAGRVVTGSEDAAATLRKWLEEPEELRKHRIAARDWAELKLAGPSPYDDLAREITALVRPGGAAPEPAG